MAPPKRNTPTKKIRLRISDDAWDALRNLTYQMVKKERQQLREQATLELALQGLRANQTNLGIVIGRDPNGTRSVGHGLDLLMSLYPPTGTHWKDTRPPDLKEEDVPRLDFMERALSSAGRYGGIGKVRWQGPIWTPTSEVTGARTPHDVIITPTTYHSLLSLAALFHIIVGHASSSSPASLLNVVVEAIAIGWLTPVK